ARNQARSATATATAGGAPPFPATGPILAGSGSPVKPIVAASAKTVASTSTNPGVAATTGASPIVATTPSPTSAGPIVVAGAKPPVTSASATLSSSNGHPSPTPTPSGGRERQNDRRRQDVGQHL